MRKPAQILLGVFLLISAATVSRTLAGSITIGAGNVEFGQGVLIVTNCDSTIFAQPIPRSISGSYFLDGIEFSGIDTVSCDNRDFRVKVFNNSVATNFATNVAEVEVRLYGGFFYSLTPGIRLTSGDSKGWFLITVEGTPTLASGNLRRITLESERADQFEACDVTPAVVGSERTYVFSTIGACLFTSPHTKNGASYAIVGGGGGGGGGSAVSNAFGGAEGAGGGGGGGGGGEVLTGTTNLVANGKYLIVVGAGGTGGAGGSTSGGVGWNGNAGIAGYTSAAFGQRARSGFGGLGGGSNLDAEGINDSGCSGNSSQGTGGIGGVSGNLNAGGLKSCSHAGGAGGGGSSGSGATPTSNSGASGGAGTSGIIATYGTGGSGGNGSTASSPANVSASTTYGNGGTGGTGAKAGASTVGVGSVGGSGAPGVVILRYTP